jgi:hypothetical protein
MAISHATVSGGPAVPGKIAGPEWDAPHVGNNLGVFNVLDYGAVGDGVADDTAAIQDAIDAAGATIDTAHRGGTVWFPPGAYIITASLVIGNFVRLTGSGRPWHTAELGLFGDPAGYYGADIAAGGALNFDMFTQSEPTNGNSGIEIDHLRLDQRGVTGDKDVISMAYLWRGYFHDLDILGATGTTNKRGIAIDAGEEIRIYDNRFDKCGIYYVGNAARICGNDIGDDQIYGIYLINNSGSIVHDNHIYNSTSYGIFGFNLVGATIIGNHMEDCDSHGMYFANKLTDSVIADNVVNQNSRGGAGNANGITIDSDTAASPSTRNIIRGNQCIDLQASPTQGYGIYLASFSGTQTINNLVEGNSFFGNVTAGFGQKAGMTNFFRNNRGYVTENSGTGSIASGATSAVITHGLAVTPALKDISITLGELSTNDPGQVYVDTITSTQFTVRCRNNPGASNLDFAWQAIVL